MSRLFVGVTGASGAVYGLRLIEVLLAAGHEVHAVTLTGSAGSVVHVTPLNTTQTGILAACKVTPPPPGKDLTSINRDSRVIG